jgi:hypothetical protein
LRIVVAVRCFNEEKNIEGFMRGYDFADEIVVSDGGSTDDSVSILSRYSKVHLLNFDGRETVDGHTWNPDAPHMNFVLDSAKELKPDWLIFDDMDCHPNDTLRDSARSLLERCSQSQVNVFRLYMWGEDKYFPKMNNWFHPDYRSLWTWRPAEIDIHADPIQKHGTMVGLSDNPYGIELPACLLHRSWHPDTIEQKMKHYTAMGLRMEHPLSFAGEPEPLPEWACE